MRCQNRHGIAAMNWSCLFAATTILMLATPSLAQRCNPAIDGTYCNELPKVKIDLSTPPPTSDFGRMQTVGSDFAAGRDQPGTLGAISFRNDGTTCVGLFRRSSCN